MSQKILNSIDPDMPSVQTLPGSGRFRGDHDLNPDDFVPPAKTGALRIAAVMVPVIEYPREPALLLTRRADHLHTHSGQVAFPGGKTEKGETLVETALRETEEEIGLGRSHVNVAGFLDVYETGTGFRILPVVAFVQPGFSLTLDKGEVAEAFEVPLSFLLDSANHQCHSTVWQGKRRRYYAMPWQQHYIWGATAGMIRNLYERLTDDGA